MNHEHDDDIEPEVNEGAEIETASYADVTEEIEEGEPVRDITSDEANRPQGDEGPAVDPEDEASDTI